MRRNNWTTQQLSNWLPGFTWRWGWKSAYDIEQRSFWRQLWPILRDEGFDILHVQDPLLADLCRKYRKAGKLRTKEILAHGTEESAGFLAKFDYIQHLAPWHLEQTLASKPLTLDPKRHWTALPNFVDCEVFRPAAITEERRMTRTTLGIPAEALVMGCVAAAKKGHKRIDYLIREFSSFTHPEHPGKNSEFRIQNPESRMIQDIREKSINTDRQDIQDNNSVQKFSPFLLIVGARTGETDELIALAEALIPGRYKIVTNASRAQMPDLYRTMDVFVLTSLFEMMPIALLEALASGLPCIVNKHPVLEWMIGLDQLSSCQVAELLGESQNDTPLTTNNQQPTTAAKGAFPGGLSIDMSQEGILATTLSSLTPKWIAEYGQNARSQAQQRFSKETVIAKYVEYYDEVRR